MGGVGYESPIQMHGSHQFGSQTRIDWSVIVFDCGMKLACEDKGRAQAGDKQSGDSFV